MALWPLNNIEGGQNIQDIFTRKPSTKITTLGRLHIINALDNGLSKMDVAREYSVHPQTVAYIYKQKDSIIKKYKQKLTALKDVRSLNLSISLLEWYKQEFKNGTVIYEEDMRNKAQEILSSSSEEEFESLDEWLVDFRQRHNIIKHSADSDLDVQSSKKWLKLGEQYHEDDIYVGGTCALFHTLELDDYLEGKSAENYMSLMFITNSSGVDKKKLLVVADDVFENEDSVRSLPVDFYNQTSGKPLINYNIIHHYLRTWDTQLKFDNRKIVLILDIPEILLENLHLDNISLFHPASFEFAGKALERLILCLKYQYRKLLITRFFTVKGSDTDNSVLSYLNIVSLAWYSVPIMYIHKLYYPPLEGSLQFHDNEDATECGNCSLSEWSNTCNLPLDKEVFAALDEYILCDKGLPTVNEGINSNDCVCPDLTQHSDMSIPNVETYQAMKRLITYLQSEEASASTIESARALERQLEFGALSEIQQYVAENDTSHDMEEM